ncbi:MAG: hypothetical protein ACI4JM_04305 [Oscillospiraceae bacterium]
MNNVELSPEYILKLIENINENLLKMKKFTDEILICNYDELEENIYKRDICFEKVKENFEILKGINTEQNDELHNIMSDNAEYDSLSEINKKIYDERMKMKSLAADIRSRDNLVFEKLSQCRDLMIEKIKELNSGAEANASKYYSSSAAAASQNVYFPKRNRKI